MERECCWDRKGRARGGVVLRLSWPELSAAPLLQHVQHVLTRCSLTTFDGADMATTLSPTAPVLASPSQRTPNRSHLPPNVSNVVLGNLHIKPWYPSFYPEETLGGKKKVDWLYVCQWCFRYTSEVLGICGHCVGVLARDEWHAH